MSVFNLGLRSDPYILINDPPKIGELNRVFPVLCQLTPVLVNTPR
jgi:hypothetical protein